ncbi:MAG TPA: proline--tRNA ligase [Firmicutes bacterium]|jgi:prolyl-tRNA synthetase|nr:proline--tRNA ligase [Bacillota bacterium]HOQ24830.1 proline--tRNA ligase [Bacillota bacterium]HPT67935.1 proline--tRNA ligase [Bacillota bacterium]
MKLSQYFIPTLRETPAEAEIASHQLMLRAGIIRKSSAGVYTYLPLGYRVVKKVIKIIEEEMDRAGGQELMLPIIQPSEIWKETGRWDVYGEEMFRLKDRHGREFCLGPTHEEIITTLVRNEVRSYRDLPLRLYQIQNKYRDEIRPRFGVMRGREFIMKDLYSFDKDEAGLQKSYAAMYEAYCRIFTRCGLKFRPVEADSGAIGGDASHEFMVLAQSGEALILYCDTCDYAANAEKATSVLNDKETIGEDSAMKRVQTPGKKTIEEVAVFLDVPAHRLIKTLFVQTSQGLVAVLVRGDDEVNETKLGHVLDCPWHWATPEEVAEVAPLPIGFVGPVGLDARIRVLADRRVMTMTSAVCGANEADYHLIGVRPGKDFVPSAVHDLRTAKAGEGCPRCQGKLQDTRGIEVGHIFKLGTKYSSALHATYLDEAGKEQTIIMGCYGIGVTRTVAAAIEQLHDDDGIIWPVPIAPFHVEIIAISKDQLPAAEELYRALTKAGIEVLLDDRDERPGVKFKDADLMGIPLRLTVGPKGLATGEVEVRVRATREDLRWPIAETVERVQAYLAGELQRIEKELDA